MADLKADVCVVGAGSAGLTFAYVAARFGASTVLIERGEMGGECLNTGCVPSKALLAAAKAAHAINSGAQFGIDVPQHSIDFRRVHRHVKDVIAAIAPHDSAERFESFGVRVIRAEARFVGAREIVAGNHRIAARRVVIATGSAPAVPPIHGIDRVPLLTNETIFDLDVLPEHLVIVGGGPIGIEMAQAFRRLGSQVTVVEASRSMSKDDPELAGRLLQRLKSEGAEIREEVKIRRADSPGTDRVVLTLEEQGRVSDLEGSHLLVAAGRRPNIGSLNLAAAGIEHSDKGIVVDERLRTTARGVYAIGDVVGGPQFTHVASYHASIAIRNALFYWPAKVDFRSLPWVTYTDPELAQVGMTEEQARRTHGDEIRIVSFPLEENDRAQAERNTAGLVKLIARLNGRVLGASILGSHAGELIQIWGLVIERGLKLKDVARMVAPYPTLGEVNKSAASEFYMPKLFNRWSQGVVRALSWLP